MIGSANLQPDYKVEWVYSCYPLTNPLPGIATNNTPKKKMRLTLQSLQPCASHLCAEKSKISSQKSRSTACDAQLNNGAAKMLKTTVAAAVVAMVKFSHRSERISGSPSCMYMITTTRK